MFGTVFKPLLMDDKFRVQRNSKSLAPSSNLFWMASSEFFCFSVSGLSVACLDVPEQEFMKNEATFEAEEYSAQDLRDVQELCDLAATEGEMRELEPGKRKASGKPSGSSASTEAPSSSSTARGEKDSDSGSSPSSDFKDRARAVLKAREKWSDQVGELEARCKSVAETLAQEEEAAKKEVQGTEFADQLQLHLDIVRIRTEVLKIIMTGVKDKVCDAVGQPVATAGVSISSQDLTKMPKADELFTLKGLRAAGVDFEEAKSADDLKAKQVAASKNMALMRGAVKDILNASTDLKSAKSQKKQRLEKQKARAEKQKVAAEAREQKRKAAEQKREEGKDGKKRRDPAEKTQVPGSIFDNSIAVKKVKSVDWKECGVSSGDRGPGRP